MNLKWIQKAIDSYKPKIDADTAARLELFEKIWEVQHASQKTVAKGLSYDVDDLDALERLYWSDSPILAARPVAVDATALAQTARDIAAVIADNAGLDERDALLLKTWDWESLVADADIALAGSDPQGYLEAVIEAAEASVGDQAGLAGLVLSLALKPMLEPAVHEINDALADRLKESNLEHFHSTACPVCGGDAALAYVGPVPSGPENGRQLWCGQCGNLWEFERVRCPRCGSQLQTSLHYTSVEGDEEHRIYHCDVCHGYVRTVFSTGLAGVPFAPEVEDVVMVNLDAIARSQGLGVRG